MQRLSWCSSRYRPKALIVINGNRVQKISLNCPLLSSEEDKSVNKDHDSISDKLNAIKAKASYEWKRTSFFSEGGQHSINHGIRAQPFYEIPKRRVVLIIITLIITTAYLQRKEDLSETNAYFKSIKEKKSLNKDASND